MNICVTGGAGFIGSHLTDRLLEDGHRVLVVDNLSTGRREFVDERADFIEGDIRDVRFGEWLADYEVEYVFHEAAQTAVPASMADPKTDCDINLTGLVNVLEACRKNGIKKILLPSSAAVYGDLSELPLGEDVHGIPNSFYGLSKLTGESYLRLYHETFGLPYICFRYSNVYGPRQGCGGEGGVVGIFAERAAAGRTIEVFGDGEQTRDFIYVGDVVDANIAGLEHVDVTGVFNVCTNTDTSVNRLLEILRFESKTEVVYREARTGDILHSRLDNRKATELLGFTAKVSLEEGLRLTTESL